MYHPPRFGLVFVITSIGFLVGLMRNVTLQGEFRASGYRLSLKSFPRRYVDHSIPIRCPSWTPDLTLSEIASYNLT